MGDTIMLILVLCLALYGCMELIQTIVTFIMKPSKKITGTLILPISGHCTDVELLVRAVTTQSRWAAEMTDCVLLLDAGMDAETRALAEDICGQYDNVQIGKPEELEQRFSADLC